jgi:hypothetical protein
VTSGARGTVKNAVSKNAISLVDAAKREQQSTAAVRPQKKSKLAFSSLSFSTMSDALTRATQWDINGIKLCSKL